MAKKCNLEYSGNNSSQRCIGEVERCKMDCNRGDCDQLCNGKEYCIMQCSGKKCTQRCNGPAKGCKMNCSGEECNQYCNAEEDCDMQCSGENCTQRYNGQVKRCNMKCSGRECKQYCKGKESCKMQCSDGEVCNQLCNGEGDCILRCNGEGCDQRCSGQAKGCNVTCSGKRCNQCCNAQVKSCNMQCSGKNCTQDCKRQLDKCNMQCNGIICEQTCHAHTCNMTRYGPRNRLTKQICRSGNGTCYQHIMMQCSMGSFDINCYRSGRCIASKRLNSDCSPSILYTSNVVKSASITTIQVIATPTSTVQAPLLSSSPKSFLVLVPSPSSLSSSLSFSLPPSLSSSSFPPRTTPLSPLESIEKLVNASVSEFSRIEISRNSSMQEAISLLEDFTDRYINFSKSHKGELGVGEVKAVTESVFRVAVAFEEFALNYGKYHLSGTEPSKTIVRQKMVLSIQKGYRQNTTDFSLEENELQATINISSANFAENGSVVIGCVYRELHELLQTNQDIEKENGNSRYVNTRIVTVALDPAPEKLQQDVILKFKNLKVDEGEKHCMFWSGLSKSPDGFSGDGCYVDPIKSNSEDTVCKCNHLTHFAVLVDFSGGPELSSKDVTILEIITYVGLCLSIIGILSTITLYFLLT
ncbi:adhesion G-protein coupled receptor G2-like [Pocillopora damicornis]|uniref:adhesion G-protein coupled receptor G2-like n=1 Tax=Pocillopora damicornis TaxID=46731 RepID=UPI000F54FFE9|nr:adhesion G-protein coupled receptor G2-like [Pocillopora damicornis]